MFLTIFSKYYITTGVRNQKCFRAGEFSWNLGTSINFYKGPTGKKIPDFLPGNS